MRGPQKAVFLALFSLSLLLVRPAIALYLGAGEIFRCASLWAQAGWVLFQATPWASTYGNECLTLSYLFNSIAKEIGAQVLKKPSSSPAQISWHTYRELLSHIPAPTELDKQLLVFLEKRWLAKANGYYNAEIDWLCPAFGYSLQVNPESTNCYARDPGRQTSQTYTLRMNAWKQRLPQPAYFPLILTRPTDVRPFLPSCLEISEGEEIQTLISRLSSSDQRVFVDLTNVLPQHLEDRDQWLREWEIYRAPLAKLKRALICIQRVEVEGIGGLRILPLMGSAEEEHTVLLDWVAHLGLTANPVELDRCPFAFLDRAAASTALPIESLESFQSFLNTFDWKSDRSEKNLMIQGALTILKGLFAAVSKEKWSEIFQNPTRAVVLHLSFSKIREELGSIAEEEEDGLFFNTTSHLEEIFSHITALLEITAPFSACDFPSIYLNQLISIPAPLKALTSCSLHSSAMASVAGIFKAVEQLQGSTPRVIYGENTYFECVDVSNGMSDAVPMDKATDEDWKEANLILTQFTPVWSECELPSYQNENVALILRRGLNARQGKPLTAAIDCTIDFIDSAEIGRLLRAFQKEIEAGDLNIVCYRSGLKYDLFGMDNYAGAPFYMIHNNDPKWSSFDCLTKEPTLMTDRLSASWFCLAYNYAGSHLDPYRKKIFDHTRSLLNAAPARLYDKNSEYRILPVAENAIPSFIDIRVSGPLHHLRASALLGALFYLRSMQGGHPIFYRRSFGFYHPNFGMIFGEKSTTVRLTLGLDPSQIDLFLNCLKIIDSFNGSPWQAIPW